MHIIYSNDTVRVSVLSAQHAHGPAAQLNQRRDATNASSFLSASAYTGRSLLVSRTDATLASSLLPCLPVCAPSPPLSITSLLPGDKDDSGAGSDKVCRFFSRSEPPPPPPPPPTMDLTPPPSSSSSSSYSRSEGHNSG